ncbi:MAG: transcriptional regulator, LuxR family [Acidimicrobiales bacterium]|nr:transcriptional regulator, LuxR family [Acidimicrobiales bacterium]
MAFDAFAWLLTDPESEVGTAPIADVPCLPELPRLIRLKYATPLNRWTSQPELVSTLAKTTNGDLERSLMWREMLREHDVTDIASMVFRDRFGCWAFLDLWRIGSTFSEAEIHSLADAVGVVTTALRRCALGTFRRSDAPVGGDRQGAAVVLLRNDLSLRAQTADTEAYLRAIVPAEGDRPAIPAAAYNVGAQLLAIEDHVDAHPPTVRAHLGGGAWITLRAARLDDGIAVTIEPSTSSERLDVFCRAGGLTPRETELVNNLTTGADTRAVAAEMFLSVHTVQDHLKAIFVKTGANSRRELLACCAGP